MALPLPDRVSVALGVLEKVAAPEPVLLLDVVADDDGVTAADGDAVGGAVHVGVGVGVGVRAADVVADALGVTVSDGVAVPVRVEVGESVLVAGALALAVGVAAGVSVGDGEPVLLDVELCVRVGDVDRVSVGAGVVVADGMGVSVLVCDAVPVLVAESAPVTADVAAPLADAAFSGNALVVALLLRAGADPRARDDFGRSAEDKSRPLGRGHAPVLALLQAAYAA